MKLNLDMLGVAQKWQVLFQDPATPVMEGIIEFHHDLMIILTFIVFFVLYIIVEVLRNFTGRSWDIHKPLNKVTHNTTLEIVWTIIPSLILLVVAVPSFALLYSIDELVNPSLTLKVVGHQWYWTYEYSDFAFRYGPLNIECYMIPEFYVKDGYHRLLETSYRVVLPTRLHIRTLVTSSDVLHSWAIPALGIKTDACPGRLNQAALFIKRSGVFYGQCSEICGVNHGFMPIVVEAIPFEEFEEQVEMLADRIGMPPAKAAKAAKRLFA